MYHSDPCYLVMLLRFVIVQYMKPRHSYGMSILLGKFGKKRGVVVNETFFCGGGGGNWVRAVKETTYKTQKTIQKTPSSIFMF
jgi:hypothetical protein